MNITQEQFEAAEKGKPVEIEAKGKAFVLLSRELYDRMQNPDYDGGEWTEEEMSRQAAQTFEDADNAGRIQ